MSEHSPIIDAATLDRLVDGEMNRQAQRELFARLDDEPDGWRRLALAFVESQALAADLGGVADWPRDFVEPPAEQSARRGETARASGLRPWSRVLSLAASLLICAGIGFGVGRAWQMRSNAGDKTAPSVSSGVVQAGVQATQDIAREVPDQRGPLGVFTLPTADGTQVQVPIYNASDRGEAALSPPASAMPEEVYRALRARGHHVERQNRYWPIDLGDGRQIIVPVEQVDVEYVGTRAYQ